MSTLLRVLIVEDSQDDAALLLRELRRAGYEVVSQRVETAEDMNAALDRAEWDVVLSDYSMPHFSAPNALTLVKSRQLDIPFIIVSGTIGEETAVKAMKAGAQDFLIKGNLARLSPALERELRESQIRRERRRSVEALRESEERYRTLFERNMAGVLRTTVDGRILECNQAMATILGFDSPQEILNHLTLEFFFAVEDRANFLEKLEAEGRLTNHELNWRRKDGNPLWLIANISLTTQAPSGQRIIEGTLVDITKHKLAEAENARLAVIVNSSDDAIFSCTREGVIMTWNAGAERMFGYTAEEITGKNFSILIPEDLRSGLAANEEKLMRGEALVHYEHENQRKDGSRLQSSLTLSPIKDATGFVTGVSIISRDITARKRAEEMLRDNEEKYRVLYESSRDAITLTAPPEWKFIAGNPAAIALFGARDEREFVAAAPWILSSEYQPDGELSSVKARQMIDAAMEKGSLFFEWTHKKFSGEEFFATVLLTRMIYRGQPLLQATVRDITERKQAEAEKTRLVTAIEQSVEGVVITNTKGDIEYVNPAFTRITGYSREEVLGRNPRILKSGKQDPVFYQRLWATILKGEIWHSELINRRKDGRLYTEEMNIAPVRGGGGEITHFIATKQDVTDRKHLEEQFRQAQKMEAVGRLAGGVAHDFNNLLTVINGYTEMMLDRLNADDPARGPLEEVKKAGIRAASLTRQLLAFSRQQVLAPRVLDLNALVTDTEKMLRRLMGEDIELSIVPGSGLGQVKADPGQIDQILMNLAVNARDAMPQGGKFVIETTNITLDEAYADRHGVVPPGRYVMLAVSDTGIGMDAQTQAHIFEPFFTTKEKGKGTGLGLATVYGIVKQSGGFIWVYSEPGQGTAFKIYLPRIDEAGGSVGAAEARAIPVAGSETILLVEDEEAVRTLAARILQDLGYKVIESTGPEDALRIGERHPEPIHLLLTDVVMPRMSGRKVAEHLAFLRPEMKVVYMSGYTDDSVVRHGVLEANTAFLQKPFTPATLARKVREVLDADREESS